MTSGWRSRVVLLFVMKTLLPWLIVIEILGIYNVVLWWLECEILHCGRRDEKDKTNHIFS
jgi:hypothetical protein